MTLEQMRAKRNELHANMKTLSDLEAAGTELTEEQAAEFEAADAGFDAIDKQIRRAEQVQNRAARLDEPRPSPGAKQIAATPAADPIAPDGPEAKRSFECFEEYLCAIDIARSGGSADQRLDFREIDLRGEQSMGTGTKGGFMVPEEFRADLLEVDPAATPITANAMRLPPGAAPDAAVKVPALNQDTNQYGGVTVARIGEGVAKPETDADLKMVGWTPTEIAGHIALTDQLIRNWSGAMGLAQRLLRTAINASLEQEAYSGNGVAQMNGILNSGAAYKVARETANSFTFKDIADMEARRLQRGAGGFWLYNQLHLANLIQMKDGNQNLVFQQSVVPGSPNMLMGRPAIPYEFAAAVGSLGDVALVQPNPYYVIKEGSGPFIDIGFINTDFTQNKRRVKIFLLNDGGPWLQAPFKLQNGTEVSPFVLLNVPSS